MIFAYTSCTTTARIVALWIIAILCYIKSFESVYIARAATFSKYISSLIIIAIKAFIYIARLAYLETMAVFYKLIDLLCNVRFYICTATFLCKSKTTRNINIVNIYTR